MDPGAELLVVSVNRRAGEPSGATFRRGLQPERPTLSLEPAGKIVDVPCRGNDMIAQPADQVVCVPDGRLPRPEKRAK